MARRYCSQEVHVREYETDTSWYTPASISEPGLLPLSTLGLARLYGGVGRGPDHVHDCSTMTRAAPSLTLSGVNTSTRVGLQHVIELAASRAEVLLTSELCRSVVGRNLSSFHFMHATATMMMSSRTCDYVHIIGRVPSHRIVNHFTCIIITLLYSWS